MDLQDNIYYANFHSQMLQPAKNNGADVVVTSRQQIEEARMTEYKLFPMGISQNHPVYITKKARDKKAEVIRMFMEYVSSRTARNSAKAHGFSIPEESKLPARYDNPETEKAISYWKQNKLQKPREKNTVYGHILRIHIRPAATKGKFSIPEKKQKLCTRKQGNTIPGIRIPEGCSRS